jgi:hypothetical protein
VLSIVHHPIAAVNVQIETVNRRLPTVVVVARKDPGGDNQLFTNQHLLQTAVGIMFLERNAMIPYLTNEAVSPSHLYEHFCLPMSVEHDAYI